MLGRLFRAPAGEKPRASRRQPEVPAGLRVYAIGDVHGQIELLDRLHAQIRADADQGGQLQNVVVYIGDYVDRGMHSREVVERLIGGPPPGLRGICLKGNHEEAVLDFLQDPSFGTLWRNFGGLETLYSYGVENASELKTPQDFVAASDIFAKNLPPAHLKFFKTCQPTVTFGDYFFVHAGVKPGVPLDRQREEDLLWIREEFLESTMNFGKIIVHGHTPEPEPVVRPNRIGIDTGAYMTGILTCVVLEGPDRRFLQARL